MIYVQSSYCTAQYGSLPNCLFCDLICYRARRQRYGTMCQASKCSQLGVLLQLSASGVTRAVERTREQYRLVTRPSQIFVAVGNFTMANWQYRWQS